MRMKRVSLSILSLLMTSNSFAFFCPNNFSQIEYGYTIDQVRSTCGKPDKEEKQELAPQVPQEWIYFIPQSVSMGGSTSQQGTMKTSVMFDKNGNAINISVNGIGVGATAICGQNIQLGATTDQFKTACGTPAMINKQETDPSSGQAIPPTPIVVFTYNSNPPATLIFQEGKLTEMKTAQ